MKVRTLAVDKYGKVWAGTTDGILILSYKNNKVSLERLQVPENTDQVLMNNDVVCLNAWFGTAHIICSFDVRKKIFTTFSSLDGVDETMLSEGNSAAITAGDKILFGTLNGYYLVDRKKLMTTTGSLLKLRLTDIFINGEIQSPRLNNNYKKYPAECKEIKLPSHNSVFGFRFAALNYQLQHRVHYQYMLEGYDDWQNAPKDRMDIPYYINNSCRLLYIAPSEEDNRNDKKRQVFCF